MSGAHFDDDDASASTERVLVPMMWGLVPRWHHGAEAHKHGLTTNNCRLEGIGSSKLYAPLLQSGQRCVIVCEGFYEWRTTKADAKPSERDAYYFYMPQRWSPVAKSVNTLDTDETKPDTDSKDATGSIDRRGQKHHNLLYIGGLFDLWTNAKGDTVYSYSVITFESAENFAWLHHRSPAVLETDQQIADWLDFRRIDARQALALLRPAEQLECHRVSNLVNNSRNKSEQCNKPIELVAAAKPTKPNVLQMWLGGGTKRKREQDEG